MALLNRCRNRSCTIVDRFSKSFLFLIVGISVGKADILSYFNPPKAKSDTYYASFSAHAANDPVSLKSFFHDWHGQYHPSSNQNLAIESSRLDLGVFLKDHYYIGYTYRHDVFMKASPDLTHLLYLTKNKLDLPLNREYALYLNIGGVEAQGIVCAKMLDFSSEKWGNLSVTFGVSLLYAKNVQDGVVSGNAISISPKDYDFQAVSSYYYTRNYLYDLDVDKAHGKGFSTHITAHYQYQDFTMDLIVNDLFGKIYWDKLPYSYVSMSSANKYYDSDGYAQYHPLIHGIERYIDYVQVLPVKVYAEGKYTINKHYLVSIGLESVDQYIFPFNKIAYAPNEEESYYLSYEYRFGSVTLGTKYKGMEISFSADRIIDPATVGIHLSTFFNF